MTLEWKWQLSPEWALKADHFSLTGWLPSQSPAEAMTSRACPGRVLLQAGCAAVTCAASLRSAAPLTACTTLLGTQCVRFAWGLGMSLAALAASVLQPLPCWPAQAVLCTHTGKGKGKPDLPDPGRTAPS